MAKPTPAAPFSPDYYEKDPERVLYIPREERGRAKPVRSHANYEKDPERVLYIPREERGRAKPVRSHANHRQWRRWRQGRASNAPRRAVGRRYHHMVAARVTTKLSGGEPLEP
jgi:hypothetical protein